MGDEQEKPSSPISPSALREEALKKQYQRRQELQLAYRQRTPQNTVRKGCSTCGKGRKR